jgi:hypothetical protein
MASEERQFWYALTVFAVGLGMIGASTQTAWGILFTFGGGLWLAYVERERIRTRLQKFLGVGAVRTGGRIWPSMSKRQISELRNRLAAIPAVIEGRDCRHIQILREEFPDCADLADDFADAFRNAWADPAILPSKQYGPIRDGIWIVGPRDDPRRPILLSILSEVLGAEYEPITLETTPPLIPALALIDSRMVIQIAIGRKPRGD